MKKKLALYLLVIGLILSTTSIHVLAEESSSNNRNDSPELAKDVKSAILIERDTGKILFEKEAHEQLPPASMVKIMTLLLVMEEIDKGNLKKDELISISENAANMGGSQIFLEAGEEMTVDDLLKGIAIASGNDASVALAERVAGSEEAFVKKMNEKVQALQLKNTKFQNASGLPAKEQYSTAYDMARIAKELLKYEDITNYTSIYEDYLRKGKENEFWLVNTNKLVRFYKGVDGLKTGYTNEAGYCLTSTAKKQDMRVISVVMGADTIKKRNATTSSMLDYAFNHFETKKLFDKGQIVTSIEMLKAENEKIDVVTSQSISTISQKGEDVGKIKTTVHLDQNFTLPLKKGDIVGELVISSGNKELSKTPLIVKEDVKEASYYTLFKRSLRKLSKSQ
ncbi:D-alanyl-D-alanine carboxypeptidase family protein [Virgibacillus soli]|uniref:serine-type D-Ala-D-Ala carboxypeptidase n=1 Tax=Paracerasibacillus soli TaxID=480284 RepID=A0ABU5CPT0_9BACI|nr:D-alanyl-D-alanine carboxypeptidase family protein [Virgibacillus soli]MDY0408362.1 D-alanyl-D-alanine carboxypeptidase family protein [Virgibacillus soli]